jgi:hypothetical protein
VTSATYRADVAVTAGDTGSGLRLIVDVSSKVAVNQVIRVRYDPNDLTNTTVVYRSFGTLLGAIIADLVLLVFVPSGACLVGILGYLLVRQFLRAL